MPTNCLRRWPSTTPTPGHLYSLLILAAARPSKHCQSPNTFLMLVQRLRRWPAIERALRDCPVFADCRIAMRVMFSFPDARKATSQITRYIGPMVM